MINNNNYNQECAFIFEEVQENIEIDYPYEFKFMSSEPFNNFIFDKGRENDIDCEIHQKQYKSTHVSTSSDRGEADDQLDDLSPGVVSFVDNQPNLFELERIVSDQIQEKGYNNVVLDGLDISSKDDAEDNKDIIRKKQKKSRSQIRALQAEFKKRPNWNKRSMKKLAKDLDLRVEQVYKWHWDQTNKSRSSESEASSQSHKRMKTTE